jgi:hypothetical protein
MPGCFSFVTLARKKQTSNRKKTEGLNHSSENCPVDQQEKSTVSGSSASSRQSNSTIPQNSISSSRSSRSNTFHPHKHVSFSEYMEIPSSAIHAPNNTRILRSSMSQRDLSPTRMSHSEEKRSSRPSSPDRRYSTIERSSRPHSPHFSTLEQRGRPNSSTTQHYNIPSHSTKDPPSSGRSSPTIVSQTLFGEVRRDEDPPPSPAPRPVSRGGQISPELLGEAVGSITDAMTGAIRSTLSGLQGKDGSDAQRPRYETRGEDRHDPLYLL